MMDVWNPHDDDDKPSAIVGVTRVLVAVFGVAFWYGVWCLVRAVLADMIGYGQSLGRAGSRKRIISA